MTTPRPDADSRFPTMYCKTCGGGWLTFVRCQNDSWRGWHEALEHCDFTGEVCNHASTFSFGCTPGVTRCDKCGQMFNIENIVPMLSDDEKRELEIDSHDTGKCPDCGAFNDCKPGCPSRIPSSVGNTGTDWSKLEPPK